MKASKKNNQAVEVNNNVVAQPLTERQSLRALCKQLREKYGTEERINASNSARSTAQKSALTISSASITKSCTISPS